MGGHPGCGDHNAKAVCACFTGEAPCFLGGSVCRIYMYLVRNRKRYKGVYGFLDNRQIAVTTHQNANFFHNDTSLSKKYGTTEAFAKRQKNEKGALIPQMK
jgi:hypothetical protein